MAFSGGPVEDVFSHPFFKHTHPAFNHQHQNQYQHQASVHHIGLPGSFGPYPSSLPPASYTPQQVLSPAAGMPPFLDGQLLLELETCVDILHGLPVDQHHPILERIKHKLAIINQSQPTGTELDKLDVIDSLVYISNDPTSYGFARIIQPIIADRIQQLSEAHFLPRRDDQQNQHAYYAADEISAASANDRSVQGRYPAAGWTGAFERSPLFHSEADHRSSSGREFPPSSSAGSVDEMQSNSSQGECRGPLSPMFNPSPSTYPTEGRLQNNYRVDYRSPLSPEFNPSSPLNPAEGVQPHDTYTEHRESASQGLPPLSPDTLTESTPLDLPQAQYQVSLRSVCLTRPYEADLKMNIGAYILFNKQQGQYIIGQSALASTHKITLAMNGVWAYTRRISFDTNTYEVSLGSDNCVLELEFLTL